MLVFTLKEEDSFWIGDDIQIKLIRTLKGRSTIGIIAPRDVIVDRDLVHKRKLEEQQGRDYGGES